ncbi:PI31 proteasome regulator N-terminal family protein [Cryptosporidium felis]|nr:PI31 proteasome regulator N-terminal family protein [Cryptosporidium felis]
MSASFWTTFILKSLKPENLLEYVVIISHSILLDLGYLPLKLCEIEGESFNPSDPRNYEIPIHIKDEGIFMEILPSNWKSNKNMLTFHYFNKNESYVEGKDTFESKIELTCFEKEESVFLEVCSNLAREKVKLEFPLLVNERFRTKKLKEIDLIDSIKGGIKNLLECIENQNNYVETRQTINAKAEIFETNIGTNFGMNTRFKYLGDNRLTMDPLVDDRGVRGNLVGPGSIIFKGRQEVTGKPRNIPVSSLPGVTNVPDNDLFFPPGNNGGHSFINFGK